MSMNRFANAGPIMAGLAAMSEPAKNDEPELYLLGGFHKMVEQEFAGPSPADIVRMIENISDQVSEIAAQMVDIRKRLDAIENMERGRLKCEAGIVPFPDGWHEQYLAALGFDLAAERRKQFDAREKAWQAQQSATVKISYGSCP